MTVVVFAAAALPARAPGPDTHGTADAPNKDTSVNILTPDTLLSRNDLADLAFYASIAHDYLLDLSRRTDYPMLGSDSPFSRSHRTRVHKYALRARKLGQRLERYLAQLA